MKCLSFERASEKKVQVHTVYIFLESLYGLLLLSGLVPQSAVNREYTDGLKDRVIKLARKLSLVITFIPNKSA